MKNRYVESRFIVFITIVAMLTSFMTLGVSAKKDPKPSDKYDELTIVTETLADGLNAIPYNAVLSADGGLEPYSWLAPGLPAGLSINASTGVISGTPVQITGSTLYLIHVSVTDANDITVTKDFNITVYDNHVRIIYDDSTMPALPTGYLNQYYSYILTAQNGITPYTWTSSGLPAGLLLNPQSGTISGTPTEPYDAFFVSITVTEANALYSDSLTFKIQIDDFRSMESYTPITFTQTGSVSGNDVQYKTAAEVIAALPQTVPVVLEDDSVRNIPVVWTDTDSYNASVPDSYKYTAAWINIPADVDNDNALAAPVVTVKVAAGPGNDNKNDANQDAGADANPAAPAIASRLLKDAGIKHVYVKDGVKANYINDISKLMTEDASFNGVEKSDNEAYEAAVKAYLISKGLDL